MRSLPSASEVMSSRGTARHDARFAWVAPASLRIGHFLDGAGWYGVTHCCAPNADA
ncbi:hypothetical protein [Paraburkholderia sp. UYCP14C]|uniref:hypothetical protein n=1 Tax=Paraburkholderia sp. UYCP14C TaxID=2511130 RepID=UPI001459FEDC|nr:hypothetical protein [Paraburkholderia sp. UYCP14C]